MHVKTLTVAAHLNLVCFFQRDSFQLAMQKMKTAWISIQLDRQLRNLKGRARQRSRAGGGGAGEPDSGDTPNARGLLGDVANLQNEHTELVDEIDQTIQVCCWCTFRRKVDATR
jgi:hypothetical protein